MGTLEVHSPATGELVGSVETYDVQGAAEAIERARRAQRRWASQTFAERAEIVLRFKDLLLDQAEDVATLLSTENGKPQAEAFITEILPIADLSNYFARNAERILGNQEIPLHLLKHRRSYLTYRPRGIVFIIAPWNYPFTIPFGTVIMALLAGNAVLFKPASLTPLIAMKGRELFDQAGLDRDLFQVLPCAGRIASEIIDLGVNYVNFTGSTGIGREVAARCGRALVPCSMELGGKDPAIVLEDANVDWTVRTLVWGAFCNAGQTCASVERVYVHESLYDEVVARVVERTRALRVGNPLEAEVDMGPMTDPGQLEIVIDQVDDALASGANALTGGLRLSGPGNFYPPTVLVDVDESMIALSEETFGPTLPILKVKSEEEAIARANDSVFGLDAYVFTRDRARGRRVAEQLEAGTVMVNEVLITHGMPETPWGGVKTSGIGRVHGDHGLIDLSEAYHVNEERVGMPVAWSPWWQPYTKANYQALLGTSRALLRGGLRSRVGGLVEAIRSRRS